jgi:hypothetical protein
MRILRRASQLFASTITIAKAANDHEVIMTFMVIRKMPVFAAFALVMVGPLVEVQSRTKNHNAHKDPRSRAYLHQIGISKFCLYQFGIGYNYHIQKMSIDTLKLIIIQ